MKFITTKAFNAICTCLLLSVLLPLPSTAQASDCLRWGESVDGIGMSISTADVTINESGQAEVPNLRVTFRNRGERDANLYLGIKGGAPHPFNFNFNLHVTDAGGKTRIFKYKGPAYVAGRLEPYIVRLRAGSVYALDIRMAQFWSPETKEYELNLPPGKYTVSLEFEGREPEAVNLDQQHIHKMSFWKGKLQSNTVAIRR